MRRENEMRDRTFLGIVAIVAVVLAVMVAFAGTARGDHRTPPENSLFVDTAVYLPTKVTPGGTYHYETPETNPNVAFLLNHVYDHVWTGNGSEHLPCEGGIHWIANKNVLTISNCLSTTTTTVPPTTTTTVGETTTTTESSTTTTTPTPTSSVPTPTTTVPPTSSSTTTSTPPPSTSTSQPTVPTTSGTPSETPPTLPHTGMEDQVPLVLTALGLIGMGALFVAGGKDAE